jgi:hypothetical protein
VFPVSPQHDALKFRYSEGVRKGSARGTPPGTFQDLFRCAAVAASTQDFEVEDAAVVVEFADGVDEEVAAAVVHAHEASKFALAFEETRGGFVAGGIEVAIDGFAHAGAGAGAAGGFVVDAGRARAWAGARRGRFFRKLG